MHKGPGNQSRFTLDACPALVDRSCRDADYRGVRRHIAGHDSICANSGAVTNGYPAKDGDASPNPHLVADNDWPRNMAGLPQRRVCQASVIRIPNTRIFPDHRSAANGYSRHGDQMYSARNHDPVSYGNSGTCTSFKVKIRIQEAVITNRYSAGSIYKYASKYHN